MALSRVRAFALSCLLLLTASALRAADTRIEFNRDVRPILADHCFQCHGPDQAKRKAKLRLDTAEGAAKAIVPGDTSRSELVRRITAAEPKEHMPPPMARQL